MIFSGTLPPSSHLMFTTAVTIDIYINMKTIVFAVMDTFVYTSYIFFCLYTFFFVNFNFILLLH